MGILKPFTRTEITVKDKEGHEYPWEVTFIPGVKCDIYRFSPLPRVYHPGPKLVPGPSTIRWSEESWAKWFEAHTQRIIEYNNWRDKWIELRTDIALDKQLLRSWGFI